jgi:hypothetical protein
MQERARDRRQRRQLSQFWDDALDPNVKNLARDRVLRRLGIDMSEVRAVLSGDLTGVELEERVEKRKRSRREAVRICLSRRSALARAEEKRRIYADAKHDPALAELVVEQEKDEQWGMFVRNRPWLISMDAPIWNDGEDTLHDRGTVYYARKRGDFLPEAPWVEPLIERIDAERERFST